MLKDRLFKLIISVIAISALGACGGSSSSDDSPVEASKPVVGGTAAKGIIIGGIVTANEFGSDGIVLPDSVGSAVTGQDGSYQITLDETYAGGPIELIINSATDGSTTMVCDALGGCGTRSDDVVDSQNANTVDFGEQYKPTSLEMRAMVPDAEDGETIKMQITPFTHMAAERAKNAVTLNSTAVAEANRAVSVLLGGLDIQRTIPIDITNIPVGADPRSIAYAAMVGAVLENADADGAGVPNLATALSILAGEFSDGRIEPAVVGAIIDTTNDYYVAEGIVDTSGVLSNIENTIEDSNGGLIVPNPNPILDSDAASARAFIADFNTWSSVIAMETDTPSEAFQEQLELAAEVNDLVAGNNYEITAIEAGLEAILQFIDVETNTISLVDFEFGQGVFSAGTITEADVNETTEYRIANAEFVIATDTDPEIPDQSETVSLDMVLFSPRNTAITERLELGVKNIKAVTSAREIRIDAGTITVTLADEITIDFSGDTDYDESTIERIDFELNLSATINQTLEENILVQDPNPTSVRGALELTTYPYNTLDGDFDVGLVGSFLFEGEVGDETESLTFELSASVTDAHLLEPLNAEPVDESTYYEPVYFDDDHPLLGTVGLHFTLQLAELPEARISLVSNSTALDQGNIDLTIAYGARRLVFKASNDTADGERGAIIITNQDGFVLEMDVDNPEDLISGTITFNDKVVANVNETSNGRLRVAYVDGQVDLF